MRSPNILLLPGDTGFGDIFNTPRPDEWFGVRNELAIKANEAQRRDQKQSDGNSATYALVYEPGSMIPRAVTQSELDEYMNSGEYDDRLIEIGEVDDFYS
jgi:hypothetical protein